MLLSLDSKTALEKAYDRYADMLYRLALSHLGRREDAEDAVQDVFTKYVGTSPRFSDAEHERVLQTVFTLPEKYKTAIVLHYLEGFSVEEISSMMGLSGSAVKMRLSRGRELLKNLLDKEEIYV